MAPRLILHIGMGKTGTTSLQHALAGSADRLAEQKARYLGMGFDALGPNFTGAQGLMTIARALEENRVKQGARFGAALRREAERGEFSTFILSNEAIFQRPGPMAAFLNRLAEDVDLAVVAYLRPPRDWLPSAYAQWGLRHKTQPGPIRSFQELGPVLLKTYGAITTWSAMFGDRLTVRAYDPKVDVVTDFGAAMGLALTSPAERYLPRGEEVELLLRALFNDRHPQPVAPANFNRAVLHRARSPVPSVGRMAAMATDLGGLDAMIETQRETFTFIENAFGIDMKLGRGGSGEPEAIVDAARAGAPSDGSSAPSSDAPSNQRLIDYLVELTLAQSQRLTQLERTVEALQKAQEADDPPDGSTPPRE